MANSYHSNGTTKWNDLGKSYDARGVLIKKDSFDFSFSIGTGISLHLIPNFKLAVYDRKITQ